MNLHFTQEGKEEETGADVVKYMQKIKEKSLFPLT